jgi:hypothetical protein
VFATPLSARWGNQGTGGLRALVAELAAAVRSGRQSGRQ